MSRWTQIVIHHTAGQDRSELDVEALRRYHVQERGWSDIGYHWVVERVGETWQAVMGRPMNRAGAHVRGHNLYSVGVAFVGDFMVEPPPPGQLIVGARLVAGLRESLGLKVDDIKQHGWLGNTKCPGQHFPWWRFLELVETS